MIKKILVFILLLSITVFSMLGGEESEIRLAETYFVPWFWTGIYYRTFVLLVLYIGFLILFGLNNKFTKIFLIYFCLITLVDSSIFLTQKDASNSLFILEDYKTFCLVLIAFFPISLAYYFIKNTHSSIAKKWLYLVLLAPAIGLSFIRIVYVDDWTNSSDDEKTITLDLAKNLLLKSGITPPNDTIVLAFFSTECGQCRVAAKKLSISANKNKLPFTAIVFPSSKIEAENFIEEFHLEKFPYFVMSLDSVSQISGDRAPSIFYIDKKGSKQWIGSKFNNFVLSEFENLVN